MRVHVLVIVSTCAIVIFMVGVVFLLADEQRNLTPSNPAVNTADVPPDTYQKVVSIHEERREVIDFFVAPPELIQQSLSGKKVLTYDQN